MMLVVDRLREIVADRRRSVLKWRADIGSSGHDHFGTYTSNIARDTVDLAIAAYVLDGSIDRFRQSLVEAVETQIGLLRRYQDGVPLVTEGWNTRPGPRPPVHALWKYDVSTGQFDYILYALAAARRDLAEEVARLLGAVRNGEWCDSHCFSIKHVLLGEYEAARPHLATLGRVTLLKQKEALYRMLIQLASPTPDPAEVQHLVQLFDLQHRQAIAEDDGPAGTAHEFLCLPGIAMANLARYKGVIDRVEFCSKLIPAELVI